jgi:hypothetical protein
VATAGLSPPFAIASGSRRERVTTMQVAFASLLALFVCRLLAAALLVPAWQGPDEPTHFALIQQLTRPDGRGDLAIREIERQVLQSMAQHDWWRHYQKVTPDPVPVAFSQVPEHLSNGTLDQPAYYLIAAALLRLVPAADLEQQYAALRWLSALMALLTLVCGWLGTRKLFGELTAFGATAIVALHPQFLLSAVSVNPDVLIDLCGAFIWWMIGYVAAAGRPGQLAGMLLMAAAAVVAALSKRNGLPLVLVTFVAGAVAAGVSSRRLVVLVAGGGVLVLSLVAVVLSFDYAAFEPARRLLTFWGAILRSPGSIDWTPGRLAWFAAAAIDTSWLSAGWMRFPAPEAWSWVARLLTVAGLAGAVGLYRTSPESRTALRLAAVVAIIHAGSLLAVAFIAGSAPQGRYLFGVLFPIAALVWSGILFYAGPGAQRSAMVAVLGTVAALDLTGFLFVLLPAYTP